MAYLQLTAPGRKEKSYIRGNYSTDTIYAFFRYRQVNITFAKKPGTTTRLTDLLAESMLAQKLICQKQLTDYTNLVCDRYHHKDCYPEEAPEDIYAFICQSRAAVFGQEALQKAWLLQTQLPAPESITGIDQTARKAALIAASEAVLVILTQPEYFCQMKADIADAVAQGKAVYLCVGTQPDTELPCPSLAETIPGVRLLKAGRKGIEFDPRLQGCIDRNTACLLYYGEEGILQLRDMRIDSIVHATPVGYHAQALCNLLGQNRSCVVYIPKYTDITPWVPLTSRSRLTFYHLALLANRHGDGIYSLTTENLYNRYPQAFINIYDNNGKDMPLAVTGKSFRDFDKSCDEAVAAYLEGYSNIRYCSAYYDPEGKRQPVCYDDKVQPGILVHSIRVNRAKAARVMSCPKNVTPRQLLHDLPGTALCSNFLFFLTPKLGTLYNDLRNDRPLEQADAAAGHLDYLLENREDGRKETFPLFDKTCIGMTQSGEFLFFNFRLGGGCVTLSGLPLRWEKEAVDPALPGKICVYTPFFSAEDEEADRETYRKAVGAGRVNLVILQDRVTCVRAGDVILPSVGVVLSLDKDTAAPLLEKLTALDSGYYDPNGLQTQILLDPPESIAPETWNSLQWAYGGGLSLIREGQTICDGDITQWLRKDGWMTPLSRQTQESALHKLAKHPRTAIGTTENGDLVILVYSGRTSRSSGADYREMICIARDLYPDLHTLMNVDGGGSAMLGLSCDGCFMELSVPATSSGSCAGMVRPIHTIFYIPAEKEHGI